MDKSSEYANAAVEVKGKPRPKVGMGEKMRLSGIVLGQEVSAYRPEKAGPTPGVMAGCSKPSVEISEGKGREATVEYLGEKMRFSSKQFASAFNKFQEDDKRLIAAYHKTRSPVKCIKETGRQCSAHTIGKRLRVLARRAGADGIRELFARNTALKKTATAKDLLAKIESQGFRCALSGLPITPETASLDHIVPVSEGGSHSVANLQWVHTSVNVMKARLSQMEFIETCKKVAARNR